MFRFLLSVVRRHNTTSVAFGFLAALLTGPLGLSAEPLDRPACDRLQAEKQALVVLGVEKELGKGPEWAKANLAQAELNLLKRFIDLDEQLQFRCGMAMVTLQIPDEPEDGPDDEPAAAPASSAPPLPPRRDQTGLKPAAKPAAAPAKTQPAAVKPGAGPVAPAVKPAAKATPKAQSLWNTQTAPVTSIPPAAAAEQIDAKSKQKRPRRVETGDGG